MLSQRINPERQRLYAIALITQELNRRAQRQTIDESDWRAWLLAIVPAYTASGYAPRHERFWEWVWSVEAGQRPAPFVAIWPRGGGKSTSAELAVVALGALQRRRYVLYVSGTQDQADKHIQTIAAILESSHIETYYPALGARLLGKFGHSKGWTRQYVRTASGFTVEAIGLDKYVRGIKRDGQRPDLIILDDIDSLHDSAETVAKKSEKIRMGILPAGTADVAVLAVQNLITNYGIFAQIVEGKAQMLSDRVVSGPHPAVHDLDYETHYDGAEIRYTLTAGVPDWQGQDLTACQGMVDTFGMPAFLNECQHNVGAGTHFIYLSHFDTERNTCPRFAIPDAWQRYCGVDFGGVNTAAVLLAEDPQSGKLYLYREYHAGDLSSKDHAAAILAGEPMIPITAGGAKSEGQWRREFKLGGLPVKEPAIADVEIGIKRIQQVLQDRNLVIFEDMHGVLGEIKTYRRKKDAQGNATNEIEDKSRYHRLDALRYIVGRIRK